MLLPLPITAASRSNRGSEDYNILARLKPQALAGSGGYGCDCRRDEGQYPHTILRTAG
jgi:hypothetical protein